MGDAEQLDPGVLEILHELGLELLVHVDMGEVDLLEAFTGEFGLESEVDALGEGEHLVAFCVEFEHLELWV